MNDGRIVLSMSLAPVLDARLRPGSVRCLALLRSLAGTKRTFATYTCSIARQLNRCANTVRAYVRELSAAGYIHWLTSKRTGVSVVMILLPVETPSRRAALEDGAQFCAPIKPSRVLQYPRRNLPPLIPAVQLPGPRYFTPHPPVRTVAEQIAAVLGR